MGKAAVQTVTIASGASLSTAAHIGGRTVVGIQMPASGWDSAGITFQASADGVTYVNMYTTAAEVSFITTVDADRWIMFQPTQLIAGPYIKIRSGTAATPVNQTADRVLKIASRD